MFFYFLTGFIIPSTMLVVAERGTSTQEEPLWVMMKMDTKMYIFLVFFDLLILTFEVSCCTKPTIQYTLRIVAMWRLIHTKRHRHWRTECLVWWNRIQIVRQSFYGGRFVWDGWDAIPKTCPRGEKCTYLGLCGPFIDNAYCRFENACDSLIEG